MKVYGFEAYGKFLESLEFKEDSYIFDVFKHNFEHSSEIAYQETMRNFETILNSYGFEITHKEEATYYTINFGSRIFFSYKDRRFVLIFISGRIDLWDITHEKESRAIKHLLGSDSQHYYQKEKGLKVLKLGRMWQLRDIRQAVLQTFNQ